MPRQSRSLVRLIEDALFSPNIFPSYNTDVNVFSYNTDLSQDFSQEFMQNLVHDIVQQLVEPLDIPSSTENTSSSETSSEGEGDFSVEPQEEF